VFENPVGAAFPAANSTQPVAMQSAADDSLLGRLSRQMQASPPAAAPVTPAAPAPRTREQTSMPAADAIPFQTEPAPRTGPGRAGLPEEQLPEDLYPSIHSAAMQRITSEAARPVEAVQQKVGQVIEKAKPAEALRQPVQDIASAVLQSQGWLPSGETPAPTPMPTTPQMNAAGGSNLNPLDIQGEQLRQQLPATMQDTLRMFTPLEQPSAQWLTDGPL
jgi:hypothetical protein